MLKVKTESQEKGPIDFIKLLIKKLRTKKPISGLFIKLSDIHCWFLYLINKNNMLYYIAKKNKISTLRTLTLNNVLEIKNDKSKFESSGR